MRKAPLFVIFPFLILIGVSINANAQYDIPPTIDAYTNQSFYDYGQSVGVSGKIKNFDSSSHSNLILTYNVLDPNGVLVKSGQAKPGEFGAFNFNFIAKGDSFEPSGNYLIELFFDNAQSDLLMIFSGGKSQADDVVPPKILQPKDIVLTAETHDAVTMVAFEVLATDDIDENVKPTCKPDSGYLFGIGETIVKCTAKDSAGNFANPVTFKVIVNPPITSIPSWIKNVAEFWCQNQIDDASFVEAIQFLIDNKIILVPATTKGEAVEQEVPQWVKNNACWWSEDSITDLDFATGLEFLVKQGIIRV